MNLSHETKVIFEERLAVLPDEVRNALTSIDWATSVVTIGRKYGLGIDDLDEIHTVIMKALTGLIPPEHFEDELINALALSPQTTNAVIAELNQQVFEPIHNRVMNGGKSEDPLHQVGLAVSEPDKTIVPMNEALPAPLQGERKNQEIHHQEVSLDDMLKKSS